MLFRISGRWAGMRLELLVVLISTLTNLMAVITHGTLSPALVGLAISYTTQVSKQSLIVVIHIRDFVYANPDSTNFIVVNLI